MRVYYLNAEYEPGKHKILRVWSAKLMFPRPEENVNEAINAPYSVLEFDEDFNRNLAREVDNNSRLGPRGTIIPDKFYVDSAVPPTVHWSDSGAVVAVTANPNKADWVASVLAGATDLQIDNWFAANVTTLAQARTTMAMMAKLIARLARQAGFE